LAIEAVNLPINKLYNSRTKLLNIS